MLEQLNYSERSLLEDILEIVGVQEQEELDNLTEKLSELIIKYSVYEIIEDEQMFSSEICDYSNLIDFVSENLGINEEDILDNHHAEEILRENEYVVYRI